MLPGESLLSRHRCWTTTTGKTPASGHNNNAHSVCEYNGEIPSSITAIAPNDDEETALENVDDPTKLMRIHAYYSRGT